MKLVKPHISEKTVKLAKISQFTLNVDKDATKGMIRNFIKDYYGLKAKSIGIINKKSLSKKTGKGYVIDRGFKKAIVSLTKKQQIPGFEMALDTEKESKKSKKP